jgi:hypothetical protein
MAKSQGGAQGRKSGQGFSLVSYQNKQQKTSQVFIMAKRRVSPARRHPTAPY